MKMKKFLLCMTTVFIVANTVSPNAFAAEVNTVEQTQNSEAENDTVQTILDDKNVANVELEDTALTETNNQNEVKDTTTSDSDKEKATNKKTQKKETKKSKPAKTTKKTVKKVTKNKKSSKTTYNKADLRLLASIIYCEANGQSYAGKLAVAIVVKNRVESRIFPSTMKGVIYQKSQFGPVRNGSLNRALKEYDNGRFTSKAEKQCIKVAKEALSGKKVITYTKNGKKVKKNLNGYLYFSGRLSNSRFSLGSHQFK